MRNKVLAILLVSLFIFPFVFSCFSENLKIGYVNIFEIFNEYEKTKEYDKKLDGEKEVVEKKLSGKKESIEKIQNKLSLLKEDKRGKEEEKMKKEVQEYNDIRQKAFTDIKKQRDEKMKEIVEDINKIIEDYAKKNKFNLILNESSLLYGDKVMDITSDILKISNRQYKKK